MDETHPQYVQALVKAYATLKLPEDQLRAKLRIKSNWKEDRLPTKEELAILILNWAEEADRTLRK